VGESGFNRQLTFNEHETLLANANYIRRELIALKIGSVEFKAKEEIQAGSGGITEEDVSKAEIAVPGQPSYRIV
jgi:hypothetical protein